MLGSFNNQKIIYFAHKESNSDKIDKIVQVVLDRPSKNMASLMKNIQYGIINTSDTITMGYYDVILLSYTNKLQ